MRYALAAAGLVAAVQAGKVTLTAVEEVTITSCAPTHTACPYKNHDNEWETWDPKDPTDAKTTDAAHTWGTWDPKDPSEETSTATWGTWDPKDPAEETATATWGTCDPKDPAASTAWGTWDPAAPKTTDPAHTWGTWDPKDPSEETATGTWGTWDPKDPSEETATATWGTWDPAESTETPAASTWAAWESAAASTPDAASCPQYTATAPPAWFSQLPSSVLSSLAAKWTGAPPADWCYYSYTNGVVTETKTPDAAASTWAAWSSAADPTATSVKGVEATASGPIAKYTGAANANAASFVMAGAAAVAAVVLA